MPAPSASPRLDWRWFSAILALAIVTLVARAMLGRGDAPFFADTDDAMRMVMVRDFLAGQSWYDLVQHRLNTPLGAEMHWSRLVDLPLALLLGGLTPFVGADAAMVLAGTLWPLLLLALLLWLSARIVLDLVGEAGLLPALVLPVLSPAIMAEFTPGRVDHHNVVIVLTLAMLWLSLLALRRPRLGWAAGLAGATALAVAIEAIPLVLAAILVFGLAYVADPARTMALRRFGLGFGGGLALHLALARPPGRWLEAACDMLSPVYVLAGLLVGAAYLLVSLVPPPRAAWQRFGLLAIFGLVAGLVLVLCYPQCLGGPYAGLDPWLKHHWLDTITEARPWHRSLLALPAYTLAVGVPVFLALPVCLMALRRSPGRRLDWLVVLVFLLCAGAVMLAQVRGARLAFMPAMPAAAWLIVAMRGAYLARPRLAPALGLVASWLAFSGLVLALGMGLVQTALPIAPGGGEVAMQQTKRSCLVPAAFADLAGLPPERVMTPIDLGAHMLLETRHEVVSAPYHRNEAGVRDTFDFFNGPADQAQAIARRRGLTLLVTCPAMPEMRGTGVPAADALVRALAIGPLPDWLHEIAAPGPLKVYAIAP